GGGVGGRGGGREGGSQSAWRAGFDREHRGAGRDGHGSSGACRSSAAPEFPSLAKKLACHQIVISLSYKNDMPAVGIPQLWRRGRVNRTALAAPRWVRCACTAEKNIRHRSRGRACARGTSQNRREP